MPPMSDASAAPRRASALPALLVLCLLAAFVLVGVLFVPFTSDDAYITMRYARHAVAGQGLIYNPGERVEGYSNPLWLGLLVLAGQAGVDFVVAAKLLGLAAGVLALLCAAGVLARLTDRRDWLPYLGLLPLVTSAPLAVYAVSGLETVLYASLLPGPRAWWAVVLCALGAALTRPEGMAVLALVLLCPGLLAAARRGAPFPDAGFTTRRDWRQYAISVPVALGVMALFLLTRHAVFGAWLPNTFYAKPPGAFGTMSLLSPLQYVRDYLLDGGLWLWLALAAWTACSPARAIRAVAVACLLVAVQLALVVHARGDWMALHRFLLPVTPLLVALGVAGLIRLMPSRPVVVVVLGLVTVLNVIQIAQVRSDFVAGRYPYSVMAGQPQEQAGRWLRRHFPPGTLVACKRIGGVGYFSDMPLVDTLGLVDRRIALIRHGSAQRGEAENEAIAREVFSRRPDVILLAAMARWDDLPLDQPPPDVAHNLRDVDAALYRGLASRGYLFLSRLPQGGDGEFVVYARPGLTSAHGAKGLSPSAPVRPSSVANRPAQMGTVPSSRRSPNSSTPDPTE
jgi:arabinofuranosyltransferase